MLDPGSRRMLGYGALSCLAASAFVLAWGLIRSEIVRIAPLNASACQSIATASLLYWAALAVSMRFLPHARQWQVIAALLVIVAAASRFEGTVVAFLTFAAAFCLGDLVVFRKDKGEWNDLGALLRIAVGLALLSWIAGLAAFVPVATPAVAFLLLATPIALGWKAFVPAAPGPPAAPAPVRRQEWLLPALTGNVLLIFLIASLLPDVGYDALSFHQVVLSTIKANGHWHFDVGRLLLAVMPMGGDFVYLPAYMLGGEYAAKLTNFGCFLLLLALVYRWARECASRNVALLCALSVAAAPLSLLETVSLFIENPWALFLSASSVVVARALDRPAPAWAPYVAAITFGAAVATKMVALAAAPALAVIALLAFRERASRRHLVYACLAGIAIALPPYATALVQTGNPVFPFFNDVFKSPLFPAIEYPVWPGTMNPRFLYDATFWSGKHIEAGPGVLGFVPLLVYPAVALVVAVGGRARDRAILAIAISFAVIVIARVAYLRYLYPSLVLMAMCVGPAIERLRSSHRAASRALVLAATGAVVASLPWLLVAAPQLRDFPAVAAFDDRAREEYVRAWAPHRVIVDRLNVEPVNGGSVAFLGTPYAAGVRRQAVVRSLLDPEFNAKLASTTTPAELRDLLAARDVAYVVTDAGTRPILAQLVPQLGSSIYEHGGARLYRIDDGAILTLERMADPGLQRLSENWHVQGKPIIDPASREVTVTNLDFIATRLPAAPASRYRFEVVARCGRSDATLRLQVVWTDANHAQIGAEVADRKCHADWRAEGLTVLAPAKTAFATPYIVAAGDSAVVARSASFRSAPVAPRR